MRKIPLQYVGSTVELSPGWYNVKLMDDDTFTVEPATESEVVATKRWYSQRRQTNNDPSYRGIKR